MKIDEICFFAAIMSEADNEYPQERANNNNNATTSRSGSQETDEGYCILANDHSSASKTFMDPNFGMRRVKSTPNLLQIPSPSRNRKKSDDSAVGSVDECETEKSSETYSPTVEKDVNSLVPDQTLQDEDRTSSVVTSPTHGDFKLLRPPSVVISDHDLHTEGEFITLDELEAAFQKTHRRRLSDCSTCSSISFAESEFCPTPPNEEDYEDEPDSSAPKTSKWRTVRTIIHQLTPFIQIYKQQQYPWVQLAGHQGNFKPGDKPGTILKKYCQREKQACEKLQQDAIADFVPKYYGVYKDPEGIEFIQLEDLLSQFNCPCVMDCKLGVRTYLEEELLKAKEKPKLRKDMYEKMFQIDPYAPTEEERRLQGVTKPRYMVWRETISTTASLGFRIEGIRRSDGSSSKDFKTTKTEEEVKAAFLTFVGGFTDVILKYLKRLYALRDALEKSQFFASHEVIGSSLLFVHDNTKASVWMIDFAKTCPLPEGTPPVSHFKPWSLGNHEDGYLIGLSNLIKIFEELSYP